jgi:tRNA nucleotidyltransferase/poly(A) polymerase
LLFEAGEDTEALMLLCRADITSKNDEKVAKYLKNFDLVEERMGAVEEKDKVRNFQPPIKGDEIIELFNIPAGPIVGEIKEQIKDAILDGEIENDKEQAFQLMLKIAEKKGLNRINK